MFSLLLQGIIIEGICSINQLGWRGCFLESFTRHYRVEDKSKKKNKKTPLHRCWELRIASTGDDVN